MKRLLSVLLCSVIALASAEAFAQKKKKKRGMKKKKAEEAGEMAPAGEKPWGMAGCGLGAMVLGGDGNQISAATTNGTSYSQTFGITTGTSNCVNPGEAAARLDQESFIIANLSTLMKEMSQGQGETLTAFADTLGCGEDVYPLVAETLQGSYDEIFRSPGAIAVLDTAKSKLHKQAVIAQSCDYLTI